MKLIEQGTEAPVSREMLYALCAALGRAPETADSVEGSEFAVRADHLSDAVHYLRQVAAQLS